MQHSGGGAEVVAAQEVAVGPGLATRSVAAVRSHAERGNEGWRDYAGLTLLGVGRSCTARGRPWRGVQIGTLRLNAWNWVSTNLRFQI